MSAAETGAEATKTLFEAIALRKYVEAVYNRTEMRFAPYVLYTRHDELFVDGVTVERNGQPPRELKLGTFKLAGLTVHGLRDGPFRIERLFDPHAEKYRGVTLFAVELAS